MRIAIVTQYYPPENFTMIPALAKDLVARGHRVRVITGFPNYPAGKLYPGYRQRYGVTEQYGEILVRRVPLFLDHSRNPIGRILNYLSFGLDVVTAGKFVKDADVVYVYASQMTSAIGPQLWRLIRGIPYVLHVQDLWPESVAGAGLLPRPAARLVAALMKPWLGSSYRRSAAVVGITPSMTRTLIERGAPQTSRTLYNWIADETESVRAPDGDDGLRLVYGGNIGEMQDLLTVIEGLNLVRDLPALAVDIYGTGTMLEEVRRRVGELGLGFVRFHGRVSREEISRAYAHADFSLVTLKDLPVFTMTIPSKFQASMVAGIPVITTVGGDLASVVVANGVGLAATPGIPLALADAIRAAHALDSDQRLEMRKSARALYEDQMSRSAGMDALEQILLNASHTSRKRENS